MVCGRLAIPDEDEEFGGGIVEEWLKPLPETPTAACHMSTG